MMNQAILKHEGDLVLALWQVECSLRFVANEVKTSQARVDIQSSDAKAVVVVPKPGRRLAVGIRRWPWIELWAVRAVFALRSEPGFWVAIVVGHCAGAVEMRNIADRRERQLGPVDGMIDGKQMRSG